MKQPLFTGSGVALVTPFTQQGIDLPALRRLVDFQLLSGTNAIIVCGTTGEASTMTAAERMQVLEAVLEQVDGAIPVIAGTGANATAVAVEQSRAAFSAGADGILVVTPYYNKATQSGLVQHFSRIADSVDGPVILYNVPSRTGISCTAETYRELSSHPNIIGVKEASGNFDLVQHTRWACPPDFYMWSGNDEDTAAMMTLGAVGVISVVANVMPAEMQQLTDAALLGDFVTAGQLQLELYPVCKALFSEVNPIPVKTALAMLGYCQEEFRLPLCPMGIDNRKRLEQLLTDTALL